ncbi:MAG: hypothetical protein HQ402_01930 [Parcubacteria group bacterium]|nr:hypothetical protein [Parcubacteria group bacterium]
MSRFRESVPNSVQKMPGSIYEAEYLFSIECDWNKDDYLAAREKDDIPTAQTILDNWVLDKTEISKEEWWALSPQDRKSVLFEWVATHQPQEWDPKDPNFKKNHDIADLKTHTETELESVIEDFDPGKFSLFTAVGTPVDTLYATDMFFVYEDDTYGPIKFTVDLTNNPAKYENDPSYKTDYVLHLTSPDNKNDHNQELQEKGRQISVGLGRIYRQAKRDAIKELPSKAA